MRNSVKKLTIPLYCLLPALIVAPSQNALAGIFEDDQTSPWRLHQKIELTYEYERNFNLDNKDDENQAVMEPEYTLGFGYAPSERFQSYAQLELAKEYGVAGPAAENQDTELEIAELYILSEGYEMPWGGELSFQLGRQRFADERQWLYDEQLDGLRLRYDYDRWHFGVSATRQRNKEVLRHRNKDETDDYMAFGNYEFDDHVLGAYVIKRHERRGGDGRPLFLGLQAYGELIDDWQYWAEVARVRGEDDGEDIRAWGVDVGTTYAFDLPLRPTLIMGYAFGTGDEKDEDGIDRNFRQTGLQDNEHDFDGVLDFRYHGVMLEPELSNMHILTLGVGINPSDRFTSYLLYHDYSQHRASDELRDTNLDTDPTGEDRDLGYAIDWVMGTELGEDVELEMVLGYFKPGEAFEESGEAFYSGMELEYKF